jgi:hypothetical protein
MPLQGPIRRFIVVSSSAYLYSSDKIGLFASVMRLERISLSASVRPGHAL